MSIRRYTVTRIDVDYYQIREEELVIKSRARIENGEIVRSDFKAWDFICSYGDNFPEYWIPEQAQKRNPRTLLRRNEETYTFYACVYHFPEPRLVGKFHDYTSALGWEG